ncbi:MAG: threonine--tRNA ligase [Phycisphaerales bacterium]|nr:threonine--tRNA ligase [Phycisphaerales bacterium]
MIKITLPNGAVKEFEGTSVTGLQVAEGIGPRLAKDAIGVVVDGELKDLSEPIGRDAKVSVVTAKGGGGDDANAMYLLRHSGAHVMAEAICRLYPQTKLAYGPPVENGFYYDMELDHKLTVDDFVKIEEEIQKILAEDRKFTRYELGQKEAMEKIEKEGNPYKVDNAQRAMEGDANAVISFYATGEPGRNWEDLCRGPHVPSTGRIGAIKVMSVAGAYWHGDESKQQLQRVYGVAFPSRKELDVYLNQLEEAKKRDHRVIGKQMGLFTISPLVGSGLILWMPKGALVRQELEQFMREELARREYVPVYTPHIGKVDLYKISGHYPYYQDSQFPTIKMKERDKEDESEYLLKPMNCPHHIQIYAAEPRSYRDLPVRLAEFGTVYRFEQSGELNGMTRVRGFTQDDAHLFCTAEQVEGEFRSTVQMVMHVFETLGFKDYECRVSLRDPASNKYVGEAANWDRAEDTLRKVVKEVGIKAEEAKGEAAFYGPKIDFMVKDVIGRKWQLGTVQLDYNLPERFELEYIGADNARHRPVMIHRAPFGSMERFTGILIEHFAGAFPVWLSPVQVAVLTISEKFNDYANGVLEKLKVVNVRAEIDLSGDKIGGKIRRAREQKIPYMLIIGGKEQEQGAVAVRTRKDKDLGAMKVEAFLEKIVGEVKTRALPVE